MKRGEGNFIGMVLYVVLLMLLMLAAGGAESVDGAESEGAESRTSSSATGGIDVPEDIRRYAEQYGEIYRICPELLEAVAFCESSYDETAENGQCVGLMQIDPAAHADRIAALRVTDLYDAGQSMYVAADYLAELFSKEGDVSLVLDLYNGNSRAHYINRSGGFSEYAEKVLTLSAALERAHGK